VPANGAGQVDAATDHAASRSISPPLSFGAEASVGFLEQSLISTLRNVRGKRRACARELGDSLDRFN